MTDNLKSLLDVSGNETYFFEAYEGFKTVESLKHNNLEEFDRSSVALHSHKSHKPRLNSLCLFRSGLAPVLVETYVPLIRRYISEAFQVSTAYRCAVVLRDLVMPYLLRRKADVDAQLPKKTETVLFCGLTPEHGKFYKSFLASSEVEHIFDGGRNSLAGIDVLKNICNHPYLLEREASERNPDYGNFERSGKMKLVERVLRLWKEQGNSVLFFAQTQQMLDIMESFLVMKGYVCRRMDCYSPVKQRMALMAEFNNSNEVFIFILTNRVGGLGTNLTGADWVILYDPDWNPSTDTQARDRAWRIGQKKDVIKNPVDSFKKKLAGCISRGEHDKASLNILLGEVNLTKVPLMLAGCVTCDLVLELKKYGVLIVSFGNGDLGLVTESFRVPMLSKEDVSRSVKEATITNLMESNELYSPELRKWAKLVIDRTRMVMQLKESLKDLDYYVYSYAEEEIDTLFKELDSGKSLLLENGSLEKMAEKDESTLRPYNSDDPYSSGDLSDCSTTQSSRRFHGSDGQFRGVINRGATISLTAQSSISTLFDDQSTFRVRISQGGHYKASFQIRSSHHVLPMPFVSGARMIHSSSPRMDNIGIDVESTKTRSAIMLEQKFESQDFEALERMRAARVEGIAAIQDLEVNPDGLYASFIVRGERAFQFIDRDRNNFLLFVRNLSAHVINASSGSLHLTCPPEIRLLRSSFLNLIQKSVNALVALEANGVDIDFGPDDINVVEIGIGYSPIIYPAGVRLCNPRKSLQQGLRYNSLVKLFQAWRAIIAGLGLEQHLGHELDDIIAKSGCWPAIWKNIEDMFYHYLLLMGPVRQNYKQRASSLALARYATRPNISQDYQKLVSAVAFRLSMFPDWRRDFVLSSRQAKYSKDLTGLLRFESNINQHCFEQDIQRTAIWGDKVGLCTFFFDKQYQSGGLITDICVDESIDLSRPK